MAVLIMMTVVWRATLPRPRPPAAARLSSPRRRAVAVDPVQVASAAGDNIEADEAWAVVRTAAEGLARRMRTRSASAPYPGSAEGVALELTAEERAELARLLNAEMKRSGV